MLTLTNFLILLCIFLCVVCFILILLVEHQHKAIKDALIQMDKIQKENEDLFFDNLRRSGIELDRNVKYDT